MDIKVQKDFFKMSIFSAILALIVALVTLFFMLPHPFNEKEILSYTELAKNIASNGTDILSTTNIPEYNYISLYSNKMMFITDKGSITFPYDSFSPSICTIDPIFETILVSILSFAGSFFVTFFISIGLYVLINKRKKKI